jgi:type VI secretion system protein ImpA
MRFDFLREPISESQPCGPDLDLEMDADYTNYTLLASGRLPSRYFDSDGTPFDRSTIDLDAELKAIHGFLEETRDARLLTLEMRFQALRGEIVGFSETVQGLAILVTSFWNDFHPQLEDGDITFRLNAIEAIDDQVQVVLPLQFASLTGGGRSSSVSLRSYLVASGAAQARGGEEAMTLDMISQIMSDERQAENLARIHEAITAALNALAEIRNAFLSNGGMMPSFDRVVDVLKQMDGVISKYRPELGGEASAEDAEEEEEAAGGGAGGAVARKPSTASLGRIKSHATADAALRAAEVYFLRFEPSNPAVVLVHQARMLIGRPMVDALDALLPSNSQYATFRFAAGIQFTMDYSRMRDVTTDVQNAGFTEEEVAPEPEPAPPAPVPAAEPEPEMPASEDQASALEDSGSDGTDGATSEDGADQVVDAGAEQQPEVAPEPEPEPSPPPPPAPVEPASFRAGSREEANDLMLGTEAFFKAVEPSSPVPLLLAKARSYLNKDFAAILGELLPES